MSVADIIGRVRITQVVEALGGKVRHNRCQAFWRRGTGFNVKLDDSVGAWFDHARGEGGGVFDLVQKIRGCKQGGSASLGRGLRRHRSRYKAAFEERETAVCVTQIQRGSCRTGMCVLDPRP